MKSHHFSFSIESSAVALGIFLAGWVLARLARYLLKKTLPEKLSIHQKILAQRMVFYIIFIITTLMALKQFGIDVSVLLGAAGILSVAIGFASQTSASNLISGLFLLGERAFSLGDTIHVGQITGEVISIDLLSTKLCTADNLMVRIPNETLIKSEVTILTRFHTRRLDVPVSVAYKENLADVRKLLLQVVSEYPHCLAEPEPQVMILNLGASAVELQLSAWCQTEQLIQTKSVLLENIKLAFDQAGIGIPFPQLEVHTI